MNEEKKSFRAHKKTSTMYIVYTDKSLLNFVVMALLGFPFYVCIR